MKSQGRKAHQVLLKSNILIFGFRIGNWCYKNTPGEISPWTCSVPNFFSQTPLPKTGCWGKWISGVNSHTKCIYPFTVPEGCLSFSSIASCSFYLHLLRFPHQCGYSYSWTINSLTHSLLSGAGRFIFFPSLQTEVRYLSVLSIYVGQCLLCLLPAVWASSGKSNKYFSNVKLSYLSDAVAEVRTARGQFLWGTRALCNWKVVRENINEAKSMLLFCCTLDKSFSGVGEVVSLRWDSSEDLIP